MRERGHTPRDPAGPPNPRGREQRLRRLGRTLLVLLVTLVIIPGAVRAQPATTAPVTLTPGVRVRVSEIARPDLAFTGKLTAQHDDTLWVAGDWGSGANVKMLADARHRVEVSTGRHNMAVQDALIAGGAGLAIGYLITSLNWAGNQVSNALGEHKDTSEAPIFIGLAGGVAAGALVGSMSTTETWVEVPRPAPAPTSSMSPAPIRVALTIRF